MTMATVTSLGEIEETLGADARSLLEHRCQTIPSDKLHLFDPETEESLVSTG
jgi:hypothetical protein